MSSDRVSKQRSRPNQKIDRKRLSEFISAFGFVMPSCDSCRKNNRECIVAEGKDRCSECALRGYTSCNPGGTSSDAYNRVLREKDRLDRERASAEEDLERAMARLQRIRRQEKFLRQKAAEMIARGVESLDELEAQERLELESNMLNQTPEFLADLGFPIPDEFLFSGGTVQATSSSS
ncbi:hypothetical protein J3458_022453 [Metarhizium acridum]|nr:hypothetical protein J3458_022577 [Metarhizium acridum]KAG8414792.1 hypothetical protein J3458_022453 [Metarhizium acridum]